MIAAKAERPICRCCGERWSRLDVMIARFLAWYAWERNRRLVRAWGAGITAYVVVSLVMWPITGYDPVTLHGAGWDALTTGVRGAWAALATWVASWM